MADRRGVSTDGRWRAAGIAAQVLAVLTLMGAVAVAHARHEEPMPIVSSAPLGNQKPLKVAVIGDSFTGNSLSGAVDPKSWHQLVFRQLRKNGIDVTADISGEPGSGYAARGKKGTTIADRARSLLDPDDALVIMFGGTSDVREKPATVAAAVSDTFTAVRKTSPRAKVIVIGPVSLVADPAPELTGVRDIVSRDAAKIDAIFVDPIADQWFGGSSSVMREDGSGPTDAGHACMADKLRPIVGRALASADPGG
jgi:hypothetical protein